MYIGDRGGPIFQKDVASGRNWYLYVIFISNIETIPNCSRSGSPIFMKFQSYSTGSYDIWQPFHVRRVSLQRETGERAAIDDYECLPNHMYQ